MWTPHAEVFDEIKDYLRMITDIAWSVDETPARCLLKSASVSNEKQKNCIAELLYHRLRFSSEREAMHDCCYLQEHDGTHTTWSFVLDSRLTPALIQRVEDLYHHMVSNRQHERELAEEYKKYLVELTGVRWSVLDSQGKLLEPIFLMIEQHMLKNVYDLLCSSFDHWSQNTHAFLQWNIKLRAFFGKERYVVSVVDCKAPLPAYYAYLKKERNRQESRAARIAQQFSERVPTVYVHVASCEHLLMPVSLVVGSHDYADIIPVLQQGGWIEADAPVSLRFPHEVELSLSVINLRQLFLDNDNLGMNAEVTQRLDEQRRMMLELQQRIDQACAEQEDSDQRLQDVTIELNTVQEKLIELQMSVGTFVDEETLSSLEEKIAELTLRFSENKISVCLR